MDDEIKAKGTKRSKRFKERNEKRQRDELGIKGEK